MNAVPLRSAANVGGHIILPAAGARGGALHRSPTHVAEANRATRLEGEVKQVPATVEDPEAPVTRFSVEAELFRHPIDRDFICSICDRVPRRPVTPNCCGHTSCKECLGRWVREKGASATCPHCREPCAAPDHIVDAPFIAMRFSGYTISCPNQGCGEGVLFGREGARIDEHMDKCPHGIVACPDCKALLKRSDMATHRPDANGPCTLMPMHCAMCDKDVPKREWAGHESDPAHVTAVMRKCSAMAAGMRKLVDDVAALRTDIAATRTETAGVKAQLVTIVGTTESKITACDTRFEGKLAEQRVALDAMFVEFEVAKWSEVKESALFSTASPLKAWGLEWWLKVEKALDGRIGLYLCCGEDGKFPVDVDYQLMVRKRNDDLGVCASVVFRTAFGKEKAWGLSKFTNTEQIEREGAYSRTEDKVTFGCRIMPVKGLKWGHTARPASSSHNNNGSLLTNNTGGPAGTLSAAAAAAAASLVRVT